MAANTKNKKNAKGRGNGRKTAQKKQQGISISQEIALWAVLALSVLILISNFGFGGYIGNAVSSFLFGVFGFFNYLMPFLLFFAAVFNIANLGSRIAKVKSVAALVFFLCLCAFTEILSNGYEKGRKLLDFYKVSAEFKSGGGLVGGLICKPLGLGIGVVGTYAVLVVLMMICIVLITEKSLFTGMQKGGTRVYQSAKKDAKLRHERAKLRREKRNLERERTLEKERADLEEQQGRRMDHRVSGVSLDTEIEPILQQLEDEKKQMETLTIERGQAESEPEVVPEPEPKREVFSDPDFEFYEIPIQGERPEAIPEPVRRPETEHDPAAEEPPVRTTKRPRSSRKEQEKDVQAVAAEIEEAAKEQPPEYVFPPVNLLKKPKKGRMGASDRDLKNTAAKLQKTLHDFNVEVTVTNVSCGPAVTRYELTPKQGVKVSRIVSLADDIKLNLAAADIRIEAPIPGKSAVGIEVPNKENSPVLLRELLESPEFQKFPSKLSFAVGKDIAGKVVVTDIAKMPHLLIAGATGAGKSVCINTIIMSILYKAKPDEVKLIMIDPKVVELSVYNGIPHLFIPVVTDPKKAAGALNWGVAEMTDRYKKFADLGVRDLKGYNEKIETIQDIEDDNKPQKLPQIVIIVDELADLMMVAPGEVEDSICRLAQLARAAGIHLIIATQRPSVNVITGLIKANMPSRIAFMVSSGVDSRTIIDMNGAEKLLGKGDMLFYPQGYQKPARVQGAFITDDEVSDVVDFLSQKNATQSYDSKMEEQITKLQQSSEAASGGGEVDVHFAEAGKFIIEKDKASIGMLQRVFKIGFNRAARMMDQLTEAGVVGPEEGTKPRKVLMTMEEFEHYLEESM